MVNGIVASSWVAAMAVGVAVAAGCSHPPPHETAPEAAHARATERPVRTVTPRAIDEMLRAAWKKADIEPAPPADDARFLRRAWLDLAGVVPPPEEVKSFLADRSPSKRHDAVARLEASPRWGEHWASLWEDLLLGPDVKVPIVDRAGFHTWVKHQFRNNVSYDRFVYQLVTATGQNASDDGKRTNGAVNWLLRFRDAPEDLAGTASRTFLGVQLQCAQCHDHKTEKWKQADFQRFTACFMQMRAQPVGDGMNKREVDLRDVERPAFLRAGKKKLDGNPYASAEPHAIDGTDFSDADNRRQALASWITTPKNPWFAKAFVNRVWAEMLGRGFVDPVDDFRPSNPAVLPEVLDRLAWDFAAHDFDVKRLVALIADTEAYQLAAMPPKKGDGKLWSRYPLKALAPDSLLDSIVAAGGMQPLLDRLGGDDLEKLREDLRRQMSFVFQVDEQSPSAIVAATIPQALTMLNGRLVNSSAAPIPGDALETVLSRATSDADAIELLYLRTLSRKPTPEELDHWQKFVHARRSVATDDGPDAPGRVAGKKNQNAAKAIAAADRRLARAERFTPKRETPRQQAYGDLLWALLNSSEFTFNH